MVDSGKGLGSGLLVVNNTNDAGIPQKLIKNAEMLESRFLKGKTFNKIMEIKQRGTMAVPGWVNQAIFYQIFPDRFNKLSKENKFINYQPWGAKPTIHGF